jgi:hypothetical protein
MAEELIRLLSEEQVYDSVSMGYALAALAHNAVGNGEMAARYAQAGIDMGSVTGAVDEDVEEVRALVALRPKGEEGWRRHWSYRKRVAGGGV